MAQKIALLMSRFSLFSFNSDPSLLKRPLDKESNGVYVIEEHFHAPDAISSGLYATEVWVVYTINKSICFEWLEDAFECIIVYDVDIIVQLKGYAVQLFIILLLVNVSHWKRINVWLIYN